MEKEKIEEYDARRDESSLLHQGTRRAGHIRGTLDFHHSRSEYNVCRNWSGIDDKPSELARQDDICRKTLPYSITDIVIFFRYDWIKILPYQSSLWCNELFTRYFRLLTCSWTKVIIRHGYSVHCERNQILIAYSRWNPVSGSGDWTQSGT